MRLGCAYSEVLILSTQFGVSGGNWKLTGDRMSWTVPVMGVQGQLQGAGDPTGAGSPMGQGSTDGSGCVDRRAGPRGVRPLSQPSPSFPAPDAAG